MVERDLAFGPRAARMLMHVAGDARLRNHGSALPPSWRTLYELSRLDDDTFAAALANGTINGEMQRKDVVAFLNDRRNGALATRHRAVRYRHVQRLRSRYLKSAKFAKLKPTTMRVRRHAVEHFLAEHGDKRVTKFKRSTFRALMDDLAGLPGAQRNLRLPSRR